MPVRHSVVNEPRKYRSRQMGLCSLKSAGLESETELWQTLWASGGSQARPISFFSTVLDRVNVGHLLSSLRVALAFLGSTAITPVSIVLVFLLLVRLFPEKKVGGCQVTQGFRIEAFWIHSVHPQFGNTNAVSIHQSRRDFI